MLLVNCFIFCLLRVLYYYWAIRSSREPPHVIRAVTGHFAERHLAERHFAERHFAERHFAERHFDILKRECYIQLASWMDNLLIL